jgi:ArsR family transcriptional regulator
MSDEFYAKQLEGMFMALADKTRLRILNLMSEGEVCVAYFTEVLGDSQPKVSRHLAYLRNADIVKTRREGKWTHYSIRWPDDDGMYEVFRTTDAAMGRDEEMLEDRRRYSSLLADVSVVPVQADMYQESRVNHNELDEFLL